MARTEISPVSIKRTGVIQAAITGIADGHKFDNEGRLFARVTNSHATLTRDVTFQTPQTVNDQEVAELIITIAALSTVLIGVFPKSTFNRPSGDADVDMVFVDYDAGNEADLAIEVYQIDRADFVL